MDDDFEQNKVLLSNLFHCFGIAQPLAQQSNQLQRASNRRSMKDSLPNPLSLRCGDLLLKLGDIPAVQDRFQALLKRRLLDEAHRKPPRFPWEEGAVEYSNDPVYCEGADAEPINSSVWLNQIRNLKLPVLMPELVLTKILDQCQTALFSSLREGTKLIQAVDSLFPGQTSLLNDVAGYVMVSPARSPRENLQELAAREGDKLPDCYEDAVPSSQMALSLLAAREIMTHLSLTLSPHTLQQEREWLTELGVFTLRSTYQLQQENTSLRLEAELPCGGSLKFQGDGFRSLAERDDAGLISLEVRDFSDDRIYPLEIRLGEQDLLTFAIRFTSGH
jgi:hypothetical protein